MVTDVLTECFVLDVKLDTLREKQPVLRENVVQWELSGRRNILVKFWGKTQQRKAIDCESLFWYSFEFFFFSSIVCVTTNLSNLP